MTEQSKIPVPGKSLIERAEEQFGLDGFAPPPVPGQLAEAANRHGVRKTVRKAVMVEETLVTPQVAEAPVAPVTPARRPEPRIDFTGPRHAIDRKGLRQRGLIVPEAQVTALLEEFRLVKRQVLTSARQGSAPKSQRVLICSPLPGEGKTFCAVNLAIALAAEKDSEVVLVDADFAKPSVLSTLGLPAGPGLMDVLARPSVKVEDCVMATDVPGLYVLPAGNQTATDSEYLASERTAEVLARLTQGAPNRMVIFDSPPALAASPASELAGHVGQALVICRADKTGESALADALSLLAACPDIKLLLNGANFSPSGRRFGSYYGYAD